MPRLPRIYVPDVSCHVFPRGIDGSAIAKDDFDRQHLLSAIRRVARCGQVRVHSFAIMSTHYHMIITPDDDRALGRAMQRIGLSHTRHFNRRYARTGTIWNERYDSSLLDTQEYWYNCLRYVDLNPFRAQVVKAPEDSPWSSYRVHALGERCDWLTPHPLYLRLGSTPAMRQAAYRSLCKVPLSDEELAALRFPGLRVAGAPLANVAASVEQV